MKATDAVNRHREYFVWQTEACVLGRPLAWRDLVLAERVDPSGHVLTAFAGESGSIRWENAKAGGREAVTTTLVAAGNEMICNNGRGTLLALNPADGHLLWSSGFNELNYQSDLIVDGGSIFFTAGGRLHVLEASSKRSLGEIEILPLATIEDNRDGILSMCSDDENIYLTCFSSVVAISKKRWQCLWKYEAGEDVYFGNQRRTPVVFNHLLILAGEDFRQNPTECFVALNRRTGEQCWSVSPPAGLGSFNPTLVAGGLLHGYALSLLDLETRETRWTANVAAVMADPVVLGGHAYVAAQSGSLAQVNVQSGNCLEVLALPGLCRSGVGDSEWLPGAAESSSAFTSELLFADGSFYFGIHDAVAERRLFCRVDLPA